jgi:hypothetical protein
VLRFVARSSHVGFLWVVTVSGFLRVIQFPLENFHSTPSTSVVRDWYNRPSSEWLMRWTVWPQPMTWNSMGDWSILFWTLTFLILRTEVWELSCYFCSQDQYFYKLFSIIINTFMQIEWDVSHLTLHIISNCYCHVSTIPWRIIPGSGLDDWIY